jgi:hypothetical protein
MTSNNRAKIIFFTRGLISIITHVNADPTAFFQKMKNFDLFYFYLPAGRAGGCVTLTDKPGGASEIEVTVTFGPTP